jgi:hypothetical protein
MCPLLNQGAIDMLLHHDEFGILKSGAVSALSVPATKGNQDAVAFLIAILEDESARPLWHMASDTLRKCAALGDAEAMAAVKRHDARSRR